MPSDIRSAYTEALARVPVLTADDHRRIAAEKVLEKYAAPWRLIRHDEVRWVAKLEIGGGARFASGSSLTSFERQVVVLTRTPDRPQRTDTKQEETAAS